MKKSEIERIIQEVNWVRSRFVKMPGNPKPERNSGCFTLFDGETGAVIEYRHAGPAEASENYERLSREKGARLFRHLKELSSWQSRNPENGEWGGAIRTVLSIFSFSGLPELGDEAIVLVAAMRLGYLGPKGASRIAGISGNHFFQELFSFCQK